MSAFRSNKVTNTFQGRIIASYGYHHLLATTNENQKFMQCFSRGKQNKVIVGDRVEYSFASKNQAIVTKVFPRLNQFERSNCFKTKTLASNIDQVIVMVATEPSVNEELLNKILIEAENKAIRPIVLLNKADIQNALMETRKRIEVIQQLGYLIFEISTQPKHGDQNSSHQEIVALLLPYLLNRTSLLVGQSGVGKSTLLNLFVPEAKAKTQCISKALGTGKHTTSLTRLFTLTSSSELIDSPGFQEFGLSHINPQKLPFAFKEFRQQLGKCHFHNCQHKNEPGCAITHEVSTGKINLSRYLLYRKILETKY